MRWVLIVLLFSLLVSIASKADMLKIAVIDSGLKKDAKVTLCNDRVIDLTGTGPNDNWKHGTNVSSIIEEINKDKDYCQYVYKAFDPIVSGSESQKATILALRDIKKRNIKVVNYSAGGELESPEEKALIKDLLNHGVFFVAAAGNENKELSTIGSCNYYPACYDERILVVGSRDVNLNMSNFTNYGSAVDLYIIGERIEAGGITMSGTSQSAAIATAYYVKTNAKTIKAPQGIEQDAYKTSAQALYKQCGMEQYINNEYKRRFPKSFQGIIENTVPFSQMLYNKKIQYEWTF